MIVNFTFHYINNHSLICSSKRNRNAMHIIIICETLNLLQYKMLHYNQNYEKKFNTFIIIGDLCKNVLIKEEACLTYNFILVTVFNNKTF